MNLRLTGLLIVLVIAVNTAIQARVECVSALESEILLRWHPDAPPEPDVLFVQDIAILAVPPAVDCSIRIIPDSPLTQKSDVPNEATAEIVSEQICRHNRLISLRLTAHRSGAPASSIQPISVRILFSPQSPPETRSAPNHAELPEPFDAIVKSIVINPESVTRWKIQRNPDESPPASFQQSSRTDESYKLSIRHDGIYRIPRPDGFASIDPRTVRITSDGMEIPIRVIGEEDGVFDPEDSIELIARSNTQADGTADPYSDTNVYWLAGGGPLGQRLPRQEAEPQAGTPAQQYIETRHIESNAESFAGDFFWMRVFAGASVDVPFQIDHPVPTSPARLRARMRGATDVEANPDHHVRLLINGQIAVDQTFNGYDWLSIDMPFPITWLVEGSNVISLECPGDTGAGDIDGVYLDWIEVDYPRAYIADADAWIVRSPIPFVPGLQHYEVSGFDSPIVRLYRMNEPLIELTDFVSEPELDEYRLRFSIPETDSTRYIATTSSGLSVPVSITLDRPTTWKSTLRGADYVIITHSDFIDSLAPLVAWRQSQGLRVAIVDVEDIYDEFNYGVFDPHAITAFCRYAFDNWEPPAASFVLLVGDASWDYKQLLPESIKRNFVPSYTKTWFEKRMSVGMNDTMRTEAGNAPATYDFLYGEPMVDDQFVCVSGDDPLPDMMIGRWAVETPNEAAVMVQKTLQYEQTSRDQFWHKRLTFVTGGFDDAEQDQFYQQSETLIATSVTPSGGYWHLNRIYKTTDNPDFGTYEQDIRSAIDNGTSIVTFLGHAGSWSWEAMFDFDDLALLNNHGLLPFIASMTCNTARFANPDMDSFGEQFVHTQDAQKGAVAFWGGCNFGGFWTDYYLAYFWYKQVFLARQKGVGASILAAKTQALLSYPDYAVIIEPYTLLGDPALQIALPSTPIIRLAGWFDTAMTSSGGGQVRLLAWVFDPDGLEHIAQVEIFAGNTPTGVMLRDDGLSGDFGPGDGVFGMQIEAGQGIASGQYGVGIRATDIDGNTGALYSLKVE